MSPLPLAWRLRAAAGALVIPPLLSLASFSWLGAQIGKLPRSGADTARFDDAALAEWVDYLLYRLPRPWRHTCLKRSAVLYHLLRRAGRPVQLHIGVRRDEQGKFAAHAWLVRDGLPYLERAPAASLHNVIARLPLDASHQS